MKNKRNNLLTIHLEPDEACVVLEKKFWDHMIHWYSIMEADTQNPTDKANWRSVINAVEHWVSHTYVDPQALLQDFDDEDYD